MKYDSNLDFALRWHLPDPLWSVVADRMTTVEMPAPRHLGAIYALATKTLSSCATKHTLGVMKVRASLQPFAYMGINFNSSMDK